MTVVVLTFACRLWWWTFNGRDKLLALLDEKPEKLYQSGDESLKIALDDGIPELGVVV